MADTQQLASAGLVGWRKTLADRVAPPVANRAPATEDQIRAVIGAAFFLLSLYYVASTIARIVKTARD